MILTFNVMGISVMLLVDEPWVNAGGGSGWRKISADDFSRLYFMATNARVPMRVY